MYIIHSIDKYILFKISLFRIHTIADNLSFKIFLLLSILHKYFFLVLINGVLMIFEDFKLMFCFYLKVDTMPFYILILAVTNRESRRIVGIFVLATSNQKSNSSCAEG